VGLKNLSSANLERWNFESDISSLPVSWFIGKSHSNEPLAIKIMNELLKKELLSMAEEDQRILRELHDSGELATVEYHPKMKQVHEKNNNRIKEIITKHGWPGVDLVGKDGAEAAWLITQHAVLDTEFMDSCLPLLEKAVINKQAEGRHLAFLQDRTLNMSGKLQKYGTQFNINEHGKAVPFPIEKPEKVDDLRRELGLETLSERTNHIQKLHDKMVENKKKIASLPINADGK